jgi:meso-butanediol dehydrogenase / (S,S)-butanediol dehydrogenase / diacetyl reductase
MSKVAIVTGAARGIGEGIALKLASDGFDIVVADLPSQEEVALKVVEKIGKMGQKSTYISVDVSDAKQMYALVDQTVEVFGTFDVIVNNAGIAQVNPILDVTPEEVTKIFNINYGSALWGIQAAAKKFIELGKKGKIINAASIAAEEGFPILGIYSSTKFAVRGLTQAAAKELASKGITVNAYAPGIVLTPMWDLIDEKLHEINGKPLGQNLKENIDAIALGRGEEPEDVAGVVSFLASENSNYVTGQTIIVDGGMQFS